MHAQALAQRDIPALQAKLAELEAAAEGAGERTDTAGADATEAQRAHQVCLRTCAARHALLPAALHAHVVLVGCPASSQCWPMWRCMEACLPGQACTAWGAPGGAALLAERGAGGAAAQEAQKLVSEVVWQVDRLAGELAAARREVAQVPLPLCLRP